jgi:hypothetical protein
MTARTKPLNSWELDHNWPESGRNVAIRQGIPQDHATEANIPRDK